MTRRTSFSLLAAVGVIAVFASGAVARASTTRTYWVAAVPTTWNVVPNEKDAIGGMMYDPAQTVFPTVVYRRYSAHWRKPIANAPRSATDGGVIPGPLLHARVGDRIVVHFKNMDTLRHDPHSMHFHGVFYRPSSDGAYVPGFSGKDADVKPGQTWTYRLLAAKDSAGVWPYHDHSPSMMDSLAGGLYGELSIFRKHEKPPDREFVVFFTMLHGFMTVDGRAFVGNTPIFRAKVGQRVQWDVLTLGDDFHTFHVHGHRWVGPGGIPQDTKTVGPAESFRVQWREDNPGTWLYHCHVEQHMMDGMIGLYRVSR
jgi:FtsP/CotA-like multicopper oxidase with cupredoxin domain